MTLDQNNITNPNNFDKGIDIENNDTNNKDTANKNILEVKPKKKKKNRCSHCRKNVGLLGVKCKCGKLFCTRHLHPEEHMCEFDHKTLKIKELTSKLEKVQANKIVAI